MFACSDTAPVEAYNFFSGRVGFSNYVGISREVSRFKQTTLQGRVVLRTQSNPPRWSFLRN